MPSESARGKAEDPRMSGTVGAFRAFGIPIRLHFTFVLLLIFLLFIGIGAQQSEFWTAMYAVALFGSVLLHEIGHALASRRYGIRTLEIVMFPIGGVARLERNPKVREELWIAMAGPAVNFVLAGGIFLWIWQTGRLLPFEGLIEPTDANLPHRVALGNIILAVFNLLPAYPMDGGRILRSLLARFGPEERATRIAVRAGQILAGLMGLGGLLTSNFMLVFVALFVYLGATQEAAAVRGRSLTAGFRVRAAMVTDFRTLSHSDTVRDAADLLLATSQQDFPVMLGEQTLGLLSRGQLLRAMMSSGPDTYVAGVMDRNFTRVTPELDLAEALPLVRRAGTCALVMSEDRLEGLLTSENVSEFLMLREISAKQHARGEAGAG